MEDRNITNEENLNPETATAPMPENVTEQKIEEQLPAAQTENTAEQATTKEEPPVYQPQMPPAGRFVYYPDGTKVFVPDPNQPPYNAPYNTPYNTPYNVPTPKKRGNGSMILGIVLAVILTACITIFAVLVVPKLVADVDVDDGETVSHVPDESKGGVLAGDDDDNKEEEEVLSVPEIVPINPLPGETYDDLVAVYESCADSCVTILCTVEINTGFYPQTGQSLGSGFIIEGSKDGKKGFYIVTNHHVVDGATEIEVKYNDGELYKATLLGSDELTDIAVLRTERTDVKPIPMGDSKELKVGQTVVAIGTPSAEVLQNTMSYGIISGLNRDIQMTNDYGTVVKTMTVIQTTATLNPGNSGGPLINMAGQVIGINAMKLMQDYEGIGFALPSTEASYIINSLIQHGKVVNGGDSFVSGTAQLGVSGYTVTDSIRDQLDLGDDCPDGVVVVNVSRGTAVYEAGLSIYDVITEFNGTKITTIEELKELITDSKAGAEVTLKFYRLGRRGEESGYHTIKFRLDTAK